MLRFRCASTVKQSNIGCFFVKKKNGKLRLIFDTRLANSEFISPAPVDLPTPSAFGNLEVGSAPVFGATGDIDNAFYRLRLPGSMDTCFRLPSIRAHYLSLNSL